MNIVKEGITVPFKDIPVGRKPGLIPHSEIEKSIIHDEIKSLLDKQVIYKCEPNDTDFISSIFVREKSSGGHRMILNLKNLNTFVEESRFKMETLTHVINIIQPNCWMSTVDLKDAFYTVPINVHDQKYFRFFWDGEYFSFRAMPNGYSLAMKVFTKIMKPPFSILRSNGHSSVIYVDDAFLQSNTKYECIDNIFDTIHLLTELGFTIHMVKSHLNPAQIRIFLGFIFNSVEMSISLTREKTDKILQKLHNLLNDETITIRQLSSLIGSMTSVFPAVPHGQMHYRSLERLKVHFLKIFKGNYDASVAFNFKRDKSYSDLLWWIENLPHTKKAILYPKIGHELFTDASNAGWGANAGSSLTGGRWSPEEAEYHINFLELLSVYFTLLSYFKDNHNAKHVRVNTDNTTTMAYINNMGGMKSIALDDLAKTIWHFCIRTNTWLSSAFIPGRENTQADKKSREFDDNTEWMLSPEIFQKIVRKLGFSPSIDLFASRLNKQIHQYCSWQPDPGCIMVNAFHHSWSTLDFYAFPPFSLMGATIAKVIRDQAQGIIIMPLWTTQYWFPVIMDQLVENPILLPRHGKILTLPFDEGRSHPLSRKLELAAVLVSGDQRRSHQYKKRLETSYGAPSETPQGRLMDKSSNVGKYFVTNKKKIPLTHL